MESNILMYKGIKFVNINIFIKFIENNFINNNCYKLEAFLEELIMQFNNSGICEYELSRNETKQGITKTIGYMYSMIDNSVVF